MVVQEIHLDSQERGKKIEMNELISGIEYGIFGGKQNKDG